MSMTQEENLDEQPKKKQGRPKGSKDKVRRKSPKKGAPRDEKPLGDSTVKVLRKPPRRPLAQDWYDFALDFWDIPPVKINDPDTTALYERTVYFFEYCKNKQVFPFFGTYCIALGVNETTVIDYREGRINCPKRAREILKNASAMLKDGIAQKGMSDSFAAPFAIWKEKSIYGYSEKTEVVVRHQGLLGDDQTPDDIVQRYALASVPELDVVETIPADTVFDALQDTEEPVNLAGTEDTTEAEEEP